MRNTCAEASFPASASALWPSVLLLPLLSAEAGQVASGASGRVGVT